MEAFYTFMVLLVLVINLIVLIKFFQMVSDIRSIKIMQERVCNIAPGGIASGGVLVDKTVPSIVVTKESIGDLKYNVSGGDVEFADGLKGRIVRYNGYKECSVITDDNFELLYNDFDFAVVALHAYLVDKTELQEELYEKRPYKK